jgi:hypothetical protein
MIVCGIELSGNDAIICLLKQEAGIFILPECRSTRIPCANPDRAEDLQYFQKTFVKLVEDYQIDQLVIRARQKKGKFAGGANGFKLEAVLQVAPKLKVSLMDASEQKANLKNYGVPISFSDTKLKKFQEPAFTVAFAYFAGKHEW